jgi:hypothetical protein
MSDEDAIDPGRLGDGQLHDRREQVTTYLSREIAQINPDLILTHDLAGLG